MRRQSLFLTLTLIAGIACAGEADVENVTIRALSGQSFRINATLKHTDAGWEHYADAWDVLDESGKVLGTRVLHHPHVDEQPFTRSLTLNIPASVKTITVRARDSQHEYGGKVFSIGVPHAQ